MNNTYEIRKNNEEDSNLSHNENIISHIFTDEDEVIHYASAINIIPDIHNNSIYKSAISNISLKDEDNMIRNMINKTDNNNGWDDDANITIKNWYNIFKQQSFIYQLILDKNRLISDRLSVISIISSTSLGLFTGFKLWKENDIIFQTTSNIILMLSNFSVAIMTALSKRYIDDKRNESITQYIEHVDIFLGEISAQLLKSTHYRMNADEFFKINNDKYTSLISSAPSLSISEIEYGKKQYNNYTKHII
jgi:hypothetical protein